MKTTLKAQMSQQIAMTPQLLQSIRLLQLDSLRLEQEVRRMLERNPLLEAATRRRIGWWRSTCSTTRRSTPRCPPRPRACRWTVRLHRGATDWRRRSRAPPSSGLARAASASSPPPTSAVSCGGCACSASTPSLRDRSPWRSSAGARGAAVDRRPIALTPLAAQLRDPLGARDGDARPPPPRRGGVRGGGGLAAVQRRRQSAVPAGFRSLWRALPRRVVHEQVQPLQRTRLRHARRGGAHGHARLPVRGVGL